MEIKGKVINVLPIQKGVSKQGKEWAKATVIIETEGQYPKKIALDNMKNADSFSALAIGTEGTFHIEVESREFNGRWYTSVNCWKWETATPQASSVQPQSAPYNPGPMGAQGYQQPQAGVPSPDDEPLPF